MGTAVETPKAPATETPAAAEPKTSDPAELTASVREQLVAKLKGTTAAREKVNPKDKSEDKSKPETAALPAKKPEKTGEKPAPAADKSADKTEDTKEAEADPADKELSEFQKQRREFAKHKRKKEAEFDSRERQVQTYEARAKQETELFEKDPIRWLRERGQDVRKVLLSYANEDAEDPKEKKLKEVEEKADKAAKKAAELEEEQAKRAGAEAHGRIVRGMEKAWSETDRTEAHPYLTSLYGAHQVASLAAEVALRHWRKQADAGVPMNQRKQLAPEVIFRRLEDQMRSEDERIQAARAKAKGGKTTPDSSGESPEPVRSVARSKPENPEVTPPKRRPSYDVTSRDTSIARQGTPTSGFNKEAIKQRLTELVRERLQ